MYFKKVILNIEKNIEISIYRIDIVSKKNFFEISISKYRYRCTLVLSYPRNAEVVDSSTIVIEFFFLCKNKLFETQICDFAKFLKIDSRWPEACLSRRPTDYSGEKKFRCKNRHSGDQICDLAIFWKISPQWLKARGSRQPTDNKVKIFFGVKIVILGAKYSIWRDSEKSA